MAHDPVKDGHETLQSTLGSTSTRAMTLLRRPAFALAFLMAISASAVAARATQNNAYTPSPDEQAPAAKTNAAEPAMEEVEPTGTSGSTAEQAAGNSHTLSTNATVENGQANVNVKVNGQDVPVNKTGQTHKTITTGDNAQSTIDVNITNNQSGDASSYIGSSSLSTSTTSIQTQTVISSP